MMGEGESGKVGKKALRPVTAGTKEGMEEKNKMKNEDKPEEGKDTINNEQLTR
jgi:hypothetical protein